LKNRLRNRIDEYVDTPKGKRFLVWWRNFTLPGFEGVPVYDVGKMFIEEVKHDKLGPRASAISFNFLLALFPSIIFLFSMIPVIPIPNLKENLFDLLHSIMPDDAFNLARSTIEETISKKRVDLLSFGFLFMILFSTNGVFAMMRTFSKFNPVFRKRSFFQQYGVALQLTTLLTFLLILSIGLIIGGEFLIQAVRTKLDLESNTSYILFSTLRWLIIIIMFFFTLSIIYYFGPALKQKWKFISLGATVATILSVIASLGFSFYVNNFGQYNKFYGSIGTLIVIMVWIYINSMVLIFGFELNHSILLSKYKKGQIKQSADFE